MEGYPNVLKAAVARPSSGLTQTAEERLAQILAYHESSFQFALRCCRGDRQEAEDVLQQAYAAILDGAWLTYRGEAALKTWWFGLIRGIALGFFRKLARRTRKLLQAPEPAVAPTTPEREAEVRERSRKIAALIHKLPEKQRLPMHLYYYEEMTLEEIGKVLGVSSVSTIQSRIKAGQRAFQKLLLEEGLL